VARDLDFHVISTHQDARVNNVFIDAYDHRGVVGSKHTCELWNVIFGIILSLLFNTALSKSCAYNEQWIPNLSTLHNNKIF